MATNETLQKITYESLQQFTEAINRNFAVIQNSPLYKGIPGNPGDPGDPGLRGNRGSQFLFVNYSKFALQFPNELLKASDINLIYINQKLSVFEDKQKLLIALEVSELVNNDIVILTNSIMESFDFVNNVFIDTGIAFNQDVNLAANIETKIENFVQYYVENNPQISGIHNIFSSFVTYAKNFTDTNSSNFNSAVTPSSIYMPYLLGYNSKNGVLLENHRYFGYNDSEFGSTLKGTTIFGSMKKYVDLLTATTALGESKTYTSDYAPGENNIPSAVFLQDSFTNGLMFGLKSNSNLKNFGSIFKDDSGNLIIKSDQGKIATEFSQLILNRLYFKYGKQVYFEDNLDVLKNVTISGSLHAISDIKFGINENPWFKAIGKSIYLGMSGVSSNIQIRSNIIIFNDDKYKSKVLITNSNGNLVGDYSLEAANIPLADETESTNLLRIIQTIPNSDKKVVTSNYIGFLIRKINNLSTYINNNVYKKQQFPNYDIDTLSLAKNLNVKGFADFKRQDGLTPFYVTSKTLVTNLNAQYLNGHLDTYFAKADHNHKLADLSERLYSSLQNIPTAFPPTAHTHEFIPVTNEEHFSGAGLKFMQKENDDQTLPTDGWYHLLRMQAAGYATNGLWADVAFDYMSNNVFTRRNTNGVKSDWDRLALGSEVDNKVSKFGDTMTGRMIFTNPIIDGETSVNSPITIRERGLVGQTKTANKYAPSLNFFWSNVASKSLSMLADGTLNWGGFLDGEPVLNKVWSEENDGVGSGLDADKLDNIQSTGFNRIFSANHVVNTANGNPGEVISTIQFITYLQSIGAFTFPYFCLRMNSDYDLNASIDTSDESHIGVGLIRLADSFVEVIGTPLAFTLRISTSNYLNTPGTEYTYCISSTDTTAIWRKNENHHGSNQKIEGISNIIYNNVTTPLPTPTFPMMLLDYMNYLDMPGMVTTIIPRGKKLNLQFSAPFKLSTATFVNLFLAFSINGSPGARTFANPTTNSQVIAFNDLVSVIPGTSYEIKVAWRCNANNVAEQLGQSQVPRTLIITDLT